MTRKKFMIVLVLFFIVIMWHNVTHNIKVYGKESVFKVEFVSNGGKGTMKMQTIVLDKKTTLKKCTFYRKGYIFTGWATSKNGKVKKERPNQHICVYPKNSKFIVYGRFKY